MVRNYIKDARRRRSGRTRRSPRGAAQARAALACSRRACRTGSAWPEGRRAPKSVGPRAGSKAGLSKSETIGRWPGSAAFRPSTLAAARRASSPSASVLTPGASRPARYGERIRQAARFSVRARRRCRAPWSSRSPARHIAAEARGAVVEPTRRRLPQDGVFGARRSRRQAEIRQGLRRPRPPALATSTLTSTLWGPQGGSPPSGSASKGRRGQSGKGRSRPPASRP